MNKNSLPLVSVIIATFNSEKLLPRTLNALVNQSYPQKKMEILAIDGGSTDRTIEIAKEYGCIVIDNPKTEPGNAKLLGVQNARGKYLMTLDHDEVLVNPDSVKNRVELLEQNAGCKVAFCSGYRRPKNYPLLNEYISEYGDPFSLFVYNFSKGDKFQEKALRRRCKFVKETPGYALVSFAETKHLPIVELFCLATIIDLEWFRAHSRITGDVQEMSHMFYMMLALGYPETIFLKNDPLLHYSVDSLRAYFPKLKWRIRNNIHFKEMGGNGFSGREKYIGYSSRKKYLFIPYTVLVPVSLAHAVMLAVSRKNPVYCIHPILCVYVLFEIVTEYMKKILHKTPLLTSYDGKKIIEEKNDTV